MQFRNHTVYSGASPGHWGSQFCSAKCEFTLYHTINLNEFCAAIVWLKAFLLNCTLVEIPVMYIQMPPGIFWNTTICKCDMTYYLLTMINIRCKSSWSIKGVCNESDSLLLCSFPCPQQGADEWITLAFTQMLTFRQGHEKGERQSDRVAGSESFCSLCSVYMVECVVNGLREDGTFRLSVYLLGLC